ncbi:hypothetical protein BOTBODRAFT_59372 [Botryobasidium botryosum FD-172 SS1]|uniref:Uncharacterized protein n=1 Tax=Botryobasidium botryosum (strain FD-172 SS1) TaxID=930990 RepID=A0A067M9Y4_BOTB1|nr:hypothetical protein BOTBODRAFT_59372 [Botryobasidium botryosum FD-172 SS1]
MTFGSVHYLPMALEARISLSSRRKRKWNQLHHQFVGYRLAQIDSSPSRSSPSSAASSSGAEDSDDPLIQHPDEIHAGLHHASRAVHELGFEISAIADTLAAVQREFAYATACRNRIRNSMGLVEARVPWEVLSLVMAFGAPSSSSSSSSSSSYEEEEEALRREKEELARYRTTLLGVSSYFRAIALRTPALWSRLILDRADALNPALRHRLPARLELSRSEPLAISIIIPCSSFAGKPSGPNSGSGSGSGFGFGSEDMNREEDRSADMDISPSAVRAFAQRFSKSVIPHLARVRALAVHTPFADDLGAVLRPLVGPAPALESLSLGTLRGCSRDGGSVERIRVGLETGAKLDVVRLRGVPLAVSPPSPSNSSNFFGSSLGLVSGINWGSVREMSVSMSGATMPMPMPMPPASSFSIFDLLSALGHHNQSQTHGGAGSSQLRVLEIRDYICEPDITPAFERMEKMEKVGKVELPNLKKIVLEGVSAHVASGVLDALDAPHLEWVSISIGVAAHSAPIPSSSSGSSSGGGLHGVVDAGSGSGSDSLLADSSGASTAPTIPSIPSVLARKFGNSLKHLTLTGTIAGSGSGAEGGGDGGYVYDAGCAEMLWNLEELESLRIALGDLGCLADHGAIPAPVSATTTTTAATAKMTKVGKGTPYGFCPRLKRLVLDRPASPAILKRVVSARRDMGRADGLVVLHLRGQTEHELLEGKEGRWVLDNVYCVFGGCV